MLDSIRQHALTNVWCNPRSQFQSIVKPVRITPVTGVWNQFEAVKAIYTLPEQGGKFHVYQIGQLNPVMMGLFSDRSAWIPFSVACNKENLIADIYADSGLQFPRSQCWYIITPDQNFLIAVKEQSRININLQEEEIYLRVYTNTYFQNGYVNHENDYVHVEGIVDATMDSILALQDKFQMYQALPGVVYAFVNGYKVDSINLVNVKVGDVAEFVYDSSIEMVLNFPLAELRSFVSTLDAKHKYLLHYPGSNSGGIDYINDLDFFLLKNMPNGRHKGIFYHRNTEDSVRMVTHRDYSVPVEYIDGFIARQENWVLNDITLRIHVRKTGHLRPLANESNRIKELYKMEDADVSAALLSVASTVTNWQAAVLEDSNYTKIMRSMEVDLTKRIVQDGYGYNAISKLLADTPCFVKETAGIKSVTVPIGLRSESTAYEYDASGLLIGFYIHTQGASYQPRNNHTVLVEMLAGVTSNTIDEVYGVQLSVLEANSDYRFYVCEIISGRPNNVWQDVTGTDKYAIVNGSVYWNVDTERYFTLIRGNKRILGYNLVLDNTEGVLKFSLTHNVNREGVVGTRIMQIPMGELDLFLNKRSLVEGVDYIVKFPEIAITNKVFLNANGIQEIFVRMSGFCNADMTREPPQDAGFISHGLLSDNNRFDIRDDKVQRFIVGGALYDRSELKFDETSPGVVVPDATNGRPYLIRDIVVPLYGLYDEDTYSLRAKAAVIDKNISDYLTLKIPSQEFTQPNTIASLYPVVSPFCAKIISDLISKDLDDERLTQHYNDADVFDICQRYEHLLPFDPTQDGQRPNTSYVIVHPHQHNNVLDVDIYSYKFLARVVKLYLKDRVNLSAFIRLSA